MIRALAITVSNRAAAGVYEDRSGPVLVEMLRQAGCDVVDGPLVIPDGEAVEQVLRDSVSAEYDVAVTTGGTGLTPMDQTPEMTRRVIDREIPGIGEALRSTGAAAGVPSAILSRGLAGVASRTLIVNLPGSSGGVRDGMNVLRQILVHAVDQIRGGDHPRPAASAGASSSPLGASASGASASGASASGASEGSAGFSGAKRPGGAGGSPTGESADHADDSAEIA